MPFLLPNQQCQSTEGNRMAVISNHELRPGDAAVLTKNLDNTNDTAMEGLTVVATAHTADAKQLPSYSPGGAKVHPFPAFTRICPLSTGISIC